MSVIARYELAIIDCESERTSIVLVLTVAIQKEEESLSISHFRIQSSLNLLNGQLLLSLPLLFWLSSFSVRRL